MKPKSIQLNPDGTFPMKYHRNETTTFTVSTGIYNGIVEESPIVPFKKQVAEFLEMLAVAYAIMAVAVFTVEYLVAPFLVWYFKLILS